VTERARDPLPIVESVLLPTDFSDASERAFAHALAVALIRQTRLSLLHVASGSLDETWTEFPPVRRTLERWGLLERGSPRSAVFEKLGMRVEKIAVRGRDPVRAILDHLEREPVEMVVLATEGREGLPRWLRASVAEQVARRSHALTLFVPRDARGFVSTDDGRLSLRRVLVPVDASPPADGGIAVATRVANAIGDDTVEITLLHVGASMPRVVLPEGPRWSFRQELREGDVVGAIAAAAEEREVDLVVMVTEGHHGMLDALRGTTTEQVLRRVACPMLAVPVGWPQER
jgi:nucleotide-binding universal stress UspA family protein